MIDPLWANCQGFILAQPISDAIYAYGVMVILYSRRLLVAVILSRSPVSERSEEEWAAKNLDGDSSFTLLLWNDRERWFHGNRDVVQGYHPSS